MSYRERREYRPPRRFIAFLNRVAGLLAAVGFSPRDTVALEVPGRRTGQPRRTALVYAEYEGSRYLVSLAGEAEWVRNVRAARYHATIRRGLAQSVRLEEIPAAQRPPILKAYLRKRAFSNQPSTRRSISSASHRRHPWTRS
jgi:deazaflavin-dependent oxidoreductase (nitroreductase family)